MDGWTIGADVAAMITSLSVLTATITWVSGRRRAWRQERAQTTLRNWHGYIMLEAVDTWYVRLADDPQTPTGQVVLEVLTSRDGEPDAGLAHSMRVNIERDGMLSRAPTPDEFDFLKAQRKERGYGKGIPVR
jgi:hypothetical protein